MSEPLGGLASGPPVGLTSLCQLLKGHSWKAVNMPDPLTSAPDLLPSPTISSLDPPELKSHQAEQLQSREADLPFELGQAFVHRGWQSVRLRTYRALAAVFGESHRLERFRACGSGAWVWQNAADASDFAVHADWCRDRWCQVCARKRASRIAWNLTEHIEGKTVRFITLTQIHKFELCRDSIDRLLSAFARLRRSKPWRKHVVGGCACLELKLSKTTSFWHAHLHVIAEGNFFPHAELRDAWAVASPGASIVDVRAVQSTTEVARYVTKYITKAVDGSVLADPDKLADAMRGLHGRRLVITFGSWRGLDLDRTEDFGDWVPYASLSRLIRNADAGDAKSRAILDSLKRRSDLQCHLPLGTPNPAPP
jgi:hypothetical protein